MNKSFSYLMTIFLFLNLFKSNTCEASSGTAAATTISISSGIAIGGTALFFIIRKNKKLNASADSIINYTDSLWQLTNVSFRNSNHTDAIKTAEQILSFWNSYLDALARRKKLTVIVKDSLSSIIYQSVLYSKFKPSLDSLNSIISKLPDDQEHLLAWNRHDLNAILYNIRKTVTDSIANNMKDKVFLMNMYNPVISSILKIDSLFLSVYDSERLNFTYKNRYYYNRMLEQNSPVALQQFIDDCDYYNVDKEPCEQARLTLNAPVKDVTEPDKRDNKKQLSVKKPTAIDIMNEDFTKAISTRDIELLEKYLKKYSTKNGNRKTAHLDTVRTVLESVRKELISEQIFSREHPRISEGSSEQLTITINGLSYDNENKVKRIIDTMKPEVSNITSIRFPASLSIDYSSVPPLFLLSGYIHGKKDITINDSLSQRRYTIQGAKQGFAFLDKLARLCTAALTSNIKLTYQPAYAVRFIKNGETYLTMYGSCNPSEGIDFYYFYDISVPGYANMRFPFVPKNNSISFSEKSDALEKKLVISFFKPLPGF